MSKRPGVAVRVVADDAGVEHVEQLAGQRGRSAGRTDGHAPFVTNP